MIEVEAWIPKSQRYITTTDCPGFDTVDDALRQR